MPDIEWVTPDQIAKACRPGYPGKSPSAAEITQWILMAQAMGIKSIVCFLSEDELQEYYDSHGNNLFNLYRMAGFEIAHIPATDHRHAALDAKHLKQLFTVMETLPRPVLIHCSAGMDRTGMALRTLDAAN